MSDLGALNGWQRRVEGDSTSPVHGINRVALGFNQDTRHRIIFRQDSGLHSLTLAELDRQAWCVARHLQALGVGRRDRVGVMAANRVEWVLVDLACLKLGAVVAGFEPGRFDARRLVDDYGLRTLFVDSDVTAADVIHIDLVREWAKGTEPLNTEPLNTEPLNTEPLNTEPPNTQPLNTQPPDTGRLDAERSDAHPLHRGYDRADICAIKFTSGSTGTPKGLEVTVGSIDDSLDAVQEMFRHGDGDNLLVFLRLALLQQRYWIYSALINGHDVTIASIDDALPMAEQTSPTVVMGVPGFYEELRSVVSASLPVEANLASRRSAILQRLGGRIRYLWTGSAPASPAVLAFFNDCGVPLLEGYGLNETCIVAKNYPGAVRVGSVGKVLPNKTVRFDQDGVLIVGSRTPVNCRYTWCAPGTNERTFMPTGEVKTYDLGSIDEDGFLYIHGRVDDVLTLSSGRNVLVRLIEEKVREHPQVAECVLFGSGRAYLSAIISPATDKLDRAGLARFVAELNDGLLPEQRLQALVIADPFSVDNGLLSSQFKPRRAEIHRRYAAELAAVYDGTDSGSSSIVLVAPAAIR